MIFFFYLINKAKSFSFFFLSVLLLFGSQEKTKKKTLYATAAATNAEMLSSPDHPSPPPDISALHRLSQNLESHFNDDSSNRFADAKILVGTEQVAVHRCLLVAQSPFFKNAFSNSKEVELKLKDLTKDHKVGLDALMAVLAYFV